MSFSATEAAFEGFRVTRQNPLAILLWACIWLIGLIVATLFAAPFISPFMAEIEASAGDVNALSAGALQAVSMAMLAAIPVMAILQAVLAPAVYRAVLQPEARRFAYIRLGMTEIRMLAVVALLSLLSLGLNAAGEGATAVARSTGGLVMATVVNLVLLVVTIWVTVRLSLVAPLVMRRPGLPFREGWRLTDRLFWPLLGVMLLSLAMTMLVGLLLFLIGWPMSAALQAGGVGAAGPAVLLLLLIALGVTLVSVLLWAPFAAAVGQLDKN